MLGSGGGTRLVTRFVRRQWAGAVTTASTAPPRSTADAAPLSMRDGTPESAHDHLFRLVFADPEETAAFLRTRLPDSYQRGGARPPTETHE